MSSSAKSIAKRSIWLVDKLSEVSPLVLTCKFSTCKMACSKPKLQLQFHHCGLLNNCPPNHLESFCILFYHSKTSIWWHQGCHLSWLMACTCGICDFRIFDLFSFFHQYLDCSNHVQAIKTGLGIAGKFIALEHINPTWYLCPGMSVWQYTFHPRPSSYFGCIQ